MIQLISIVFFWKEIAKTKVGLSYRKNGFSQSVDKFLKSSGYNGIS